ncbi:hypothetical protein ASF93_10240 [Microbacterium sp. Leaf347]|jgi:cytochrome oxidase assembly protein ShyY1|uniref:SURF1 family protein n=2 Tax=Microbacteriaceae TaxID=85023 RepID=UPI0006FC3B02|nr:hypothetical protein ASF93_10240 [Microbacterium sp. Leaf347]KQS05982.1 hypothetical protein ASG00_00140 [Microbacterium sp. Leaf351]OJU75560.1 MAG: hypothetical protein BGO15_01070 [Microbacterium sp. 71-23]
MSAPVTPSAEADAPQVFPPTLREVMLRPRWIAMLLLCLVVAGVFAWLGQWQLGRALSTSPVAPGASEQVQPLADVTKPGIALPDPLAGQRVEVSGSYVPDDFIVITSRLNDQTEGYWVSGQLRIADVAQPTSVAVALGFTTSKDQADAAASALNAQATADPTARVDVTGRVIADEGPVVSATKSDPFELSRMSPAALLGRWHDIAGLNVYRAYITAQTPSAGLDAIHSPAVDSGTSVNWLNIFYAAEWAIFAGFAFYLWYRLAKDAWEREVEELTGGGEDDDELPAEA